MGRLSKTKIKEDTDALNFLMKNQSKHKNKDRILLLIYEKEKRFSTRSELSEYMGISCRTTERWLSQYREGGLEKMLLPERRNRKSHLISEEVNKSIEERVMDSERGFSSYVEAKAWLETEYGLYLKYNTVREHLIRNFETKIKTPRKSHIKKDPEAIEAFLKTT